LNAIRGGSGPRGDLSVSLAPGLDLSIEDGALQLSYAFTATRTDPIALDLGLGGNSPLSVNANLAVDFQAQFSFDVSIGVDLKALFNKDFSNAFFVKLNTPPTITASILGAGLTSDTLLATLRGGQGTTLAPNGQADLSVALADGTSVPVTLGGSTT